MRRDFALAFSCCSEMSQDVQHSLSLFPFSHFNYPAKHLLSKDILSKLVLCLIFTTGLYLFSI